MNAAERTDGFGMAVAVEGGIAAVAVVGAWIFQISLREQFAEWGQPLAIAVVRGLVATAPMLLAFWILVNSNLPRLRLLREQVEWLVKEMFPTGDVFQFAMVAALAGIGEELLFRGVVQTKLADWTSPIVGLLLSSQLFGLAHALSAMYFAFAVVVGVFLGWLTMHYHDLVAPMIAHGLYDFVALVYLSRKARKRRINAPAAAPPQSEDSTRVRDE